MSGKEDGDSTKPKLNTFHIALSPAQGWCSSSFIYLFKKILLTLPVNYGNVFMDVCSMIVDLFCMSEIFLKSFLSEQFIHIQGR